MVMATRSSTGKKKEEKKKITSSEKPKPPPKVEEAEEELDSEFDEEEELFENEYHFPKNLEENTSLKTLHGKIVSAIQNDAPSLEQILNAKVRFKRKKELLEWFYVYKYSFPNSEDRILLKADLNDRLKRYQAEFKDFQKNKELFRDMEKMEKENRLYTLRKRLFDIPIDPKNRNFLLMRMNDLQSREYEDEEYFKLFYWLKRALELPFDRIIEISVLETSSFFKSIREALDKELYGMQKVKEQIMLYTHNKILYPNTNAQPLGLIGPPGVGKTSIANALSKVLSIPFQQISLGGVTHADFIKGHDFTFVGSKPGEIAQAMIKLECKNGIIFLDEFDKISENKDVVNSLLHITDSSQNHQYQDNFFGDLRIDMSSIWFVCSMNEKPRDSALRDRVFFLEIPGYSLQDKLHIVKDYLLPNSLQNLKLQATDIVLSDAVVKHLIYLTSENEQGIRTLKQAIQIIVSKLAFLQHCQQDVSVSFSLPSKYYPITFPIELNTDAIERLLKDFRKERNSSIQNLYI